MKPFPTSALDEQVEYLLLSPRSALMICNNSWSPTPFNQIITPTYMYRETLPAPPREWHTVPVLAGTAYKLKRANTESEQCFSAIHFRDYWLRQVSCYTLPTGFRLPGPPSCCVKPDTLFVGSFSIDLGSLSGRSVHPASPVLLTRTGPLDP